MSGEAWDLLVLGAGPAGCAAALVGARAGATVLVLDPGPVAGAAPGETLAPGAQAALEELGLGTLARRTGAMPHRAIVRSHGSEGAERVPLLQPGSESTEGWHVDRARLHAALQAEARGAGAVVRLGVSATGVLGDAEQVLGVATATGPVRARWVLDATGRRGWLARQLGLRRRREGPTRYVSWGLADAPAESEDGHFDATAEGWSWWAPITPERTAWVRCASTARDLAAPPVQVRARPGAGALGAADLSWSLVRPTAGPGFLLCGDAALVLDPSFGDGVERALRTGALAATTALRALREPALAPVALAVYDDHLVRAFEARARVPATGPRPPG